MAKNKPVTIWIPKHNPNKDPKFHHALILDGEGKSINELFIILSNGDLIRKGVFINFFVVKAQF